MRAFSDLPVRHKLIGIMMLTSVVAVLLACLGFIVYEQITFRGKLVRDFSILGEVIGENVAPGLAFNDATAMEKPLQSLSAEPRILAAAVFDKTGRRVAGFQRKMSRQNSRGRRTGRRAVFFNRTGSTPSRPSSWLAKGSAPFTSPRICEN